MFHKQKNTFVSGSAEVWRNVFSQSRGQCSKPTRAILKLKLHHLVKFTHVLDIRFFREAFFPLCPVQTLPQMSFACFCHRFMLPQGDEKSFKNILHNQRRPFLRTICISTEPRLTADCAIPSTKRERPLCTEAKVSTCLVCSLVRTKLSIFP